MYLEPDFLMRPAPEVLNFQRHSGLPGDTALIRLFRLWSMAEKHWPDGNTRTPDPVTVAMYAGFDAPWEEFSGAGEFVSALVSSGLATLDADGNIVLVFRADWGWLVRFGPPPRDYGSTWPKAKAAALERDRYQCVECGVTDGLEVHHIIPIRSFAHPDAANILTNLKTLCGEHHLAEEAKRRRAEKP